MTRGLPGVTAVVTVTALCCLLPRAGPVSSSL